MTSGEAAVHVGASPEAVYALVSDVTRMGEWSPETVSAEWIDGATGPALGARFKGKNKRKGSWSTKPTVIAAEPGREFAFAVGKVEKPQTVWRYRFEPAGDGCDVTESFEIPKEPGAFGRWLTKMGTGIAWSERGADLERGMQQTLERLKIAAESADD